MSDEKSQTENQRAKSEGEAQTAWAMPFQEMMEQMMTCCGCRPEQMSALWTACCGKPPENKEDHLL